MAAARPYVNLSDIPELLPGAQPSANPAQRENFEQRCRELHNQDVRETREKTEEAQARAGTGPATGGGLEAMFPNLDPSLIRAICSDSPSQQSAIDTLLALAAASAEPHAPGAEAGAATAVGALAPLSMGIEDHEKFPSLVDASGWQVGGEREFGFAERAAADGSDDLGSAWRDQAHSAKDLPGPRKQPWGPSPSAAAHSQKLLRRKAQGRPEKYAEEEPQPMTEYELRHATSQRRANRRAAGRGAKGAGRGYGGVAGGAQSETSSDEEEKEEAAER